MSNHYTATVELLVRCFSYYRTIEGMAMAARNSTETVSASTDPPRMSASLEAAVVEAAYILDAAGRR